MATRLVRKLVGERGYGLIKPGGGLISPGGGLLHTAPAPAAGASGWTGITDGASLASAMSWANAPTSLWKGDEASGATDLEGSNDLTDSGTPTHSQTNSDLDSASDAATVISMTASSTDALVASGSGVLDITTQSVAALWVGEVLSVGSFETIFGKRAAASPNAGWEIFHSNTTKYFNWVLDNGPSIDTETVSVDPRNAGPTVVLGLGDRNANNAQLFTSLGDSAGGTIAATGSLTNTTTFALGKTRLNSSGHDLAMAAVWSGAGGEGLSATEVAALEAYMGW